MDGVEQIYDMCKKNRSNLEYIQNDQSSLLSELKDLQKLLSKFDKQMDKLNPREIKYIDLFCGLGAFHTAFNKCSNNRINYKCVYACDIDADARRLYYENYNIEPKGDINNIIINNIPNFDILCAGFPCQPFSIAGKQEGFADKTKGNLFNPFILPQHVSSIREAPAKDKRG